MPRSSKTSAARTLPPLLEPLFGREEDIRAVVAHFAEGRRIVTLVGPGGIGKTQLAHEVARRVATGLAGGGLLCELGDARDLETLLRVVARTASLGQLPSSARDPSCRAAVELVAKRLGTRAETLIVLDDADGVIEAAARVVRASVDAGDGPRFLVTSREVLGIEGERVVDVAPLGREAALAMFEDRAEGGSWKPAELDALVDQLDGLPLAIELAARRSRLVSPGDLLARLGEVFRLLKTDRRDVAARHATLGATIEWSLGRLDTDESRAFACLGVFEGPFTVEAFEAVVGPLLASDPIDVAQALLRKSLVATAPSQGSARLAMLRTLRAYARERFAELDRADREATEERHARFYVERAEAETPRLYGPGAEHALDVLEADLPNLLRAFEREKGREPELAARVMASVADVVVLRNAVDLRSAVFAEARAAADAAGDPALRVRTRLVEAKVLLELANAAGAEALLVEALAIADGARLADAADVRRSLAWARIALGQADGALALLEEALVAHRATGNVRGEADALAARGLLQGLRGEIEAGHRDLENAYALHVLAGDAIRREKVREMAQVLGLVLAPEDEEGTREERIARLSAAADAHRASGRTWREAVARFQLAQLERPDPSGDRASQLPAVSLAKPSAPPWVVGPEARWVRPPGGEPLDLARHGSLRRVLDALVTRRLEEPGVAWSASALLEAGWPGERVRHESGMLRVYSVI
ncbi:MAG TPA: AAA family ATPase, partial [Labilithrix sp.]|nr:AAA family ATPase [Labilithrix sp.]